jgi:F0F1-type ATP synthase membrane subunit a
MMKTTNTFYWSFIDTLILNVATIAAIVVGIVQFLVRSFKENNGPEKTRKMIQTVLQFVDTIVEHGKVYFADPVPVVKAAQKRTKRS